MPESTKYNKIWDVVEASAGVISFVLGFAFVSLWYGYAHTMPTVADPRRGRVYALSDHGVTAYLTNPERNRLYMLGILSVLSFLVAVLVGVFIKKSWRRPQAWGNRS
jgi:uncharacterized membrane protein YoaK (UPF0700 family)